MILRLFFAGLILNLCSIQLAKTQDNTSLAEELVTFPESWQGKWQGDLQIFNSKGLAQTVPMELHILPIENTENYTWAIIYGADKEVGKRPYELQPVDPENGLYLIDEKNSIKIEAYYYSGKLYSRFEVMGSLLLSSVEKEADQLLFEIISGKLEPASTTGGETVEGEEIPPVKTYPIGVRQRAVLSIIE